MTNTKNTPIEALGRAFPMRVLRYRLGEDSGGAGRFQGGEGIGRDLLFLEDVTVWSQGCGTGRSKWSSASSSSPPPSAGRAGEPGTSPWPSAGARSSC